RCPEANRRLRVQGLTAVPQLLCVEWRGNRPLRRALSRRAGGCAVFLFLQALYVLTSSGRLHVTDEASAFFQARDLVEIGSLTVPISTVGFTFYGQRDLEGRFRAPNG